MMWEILFSRKIFLEILFLRKIFFRDKFYVFETIVFPMQCISFGIINYLLEIEIFSNKIIWSYRYYRKNICIKKSFFSKVILRDSALIKEFCNRGRGLSAASHSSITNFLTNLDKDKPDGVWDKFWIKSQKGTLTTPKKFKFHAGV